MSDLLEVLPEFHLKPHSHLLHSLEKNDITVADLITLDPKEIARKCPLPAADVQRLVEDVIQALQRDTLQGVKKRKIKAAKADKTADDGPESHEFETDLPQKFRTLDPRIDQALNGGFYPGHIVEVVGESAVGKTQFVLGLLLSVQLPPPKGLGKGSIYVSTEGPLHTKRLSQMLLHHPEYDALEPEERPSLDRVHTIATNDLEAQEHILRYQLPVAVQRFNIGLIVLDSVAANFRAEHDTRTAAQLADRAFELAKLGNILRRIAIENNLAIVVTNQVSDRFDDSKNLLQSSSPATPSSPAVPGGHASMSAVLERRREVQGLDHQQRFFTGWGDEKGKMMHEQLKTPALGLAWANQISARIVLKMESERQEYAGGNIWKDKKKSRTFSVVFAPWAGPTYCPLRYEIAMQGIVSIPDIESPKEALAAVDKEHEDLLNEAFWATDDDEEFPT
ncbi:uncharacterized protein Z520_04749 [Fonsecaea multimorphosa CBS 102226]|uniref:RecA family profile 1 domain-containing protein n=1 Tax=Fonsecaea multimorphosa CBS 102226 TaxID=1442371 RepID=A0A0D2KR31_9EURO|nr:uncharacterized protein Z520_04749 [Fonsecaea multimorphosa CBS 102226]KIX99173.1 hypothetical protein Z520_04749 [Fonsecaea multimorphosa CBS 102226]OAL26083.1 hypothetical protein AYO22_04497 [Fonsecaea multimorphosa]